jgi:hypothetical protein
MAAGRKTGGREKGAGDKPKPAPDAAPPAATLPPYRLARVDSLIAYERNARTHSAAQIDKLAAMISEFGWTNPVLVDGANGIIAGHGRVLAARQLGMVEVPTIELSHLTDEQRRAYIIADNKSAMDAGWDDELLRLELGELEEFGFDLALTGFEDVELDALFGEADAPAEDGDAKAGDGSKGAGSLAAQFGVPPFTVLNAREGWWQNRKKAWLAIGIRSEVGRGENTLGFSATVLGHSKPKAEGSDTSRAMPDAA